MSEPGSSSRKKSRPSSSSKGASASTAGTPDAAIIPKAKLEDRQATAELQLLRSQSQSTSNALPSSTDQEGNATRANVDPSSLLDPDETLPAEMQSQPLPLLAWARIIDRAQRGIGDASYNSDDDDVALEEANDERPRGELTRVVRSLAALKELGYRRAGTAWPMASEEEILRIKQRALPIVR